MKTLASPSLLDSTPDLREASPEGASRCPVHRLAAWWQRTRARLHPAPSSLPERKAAEATPRCPVGRGAKPASAFVAHAQAEAAQAVVLPGDPAADELLREARQAIYHWPADFPGFRATLDYRSGETHWQAKLEVRSSLDYTLDLPEAPERKWVRYQLEEMISHREAPESSRMASRSGVLWGDLDPLYGQKVIFAGDKMGSYYRIQNRKITQIHRAYGALGFIINIDAHADFGGRFAAESYTAFYRNRSTGQLAKVETYLDRYQTIGGVHLPCERRFSEAGAERLVNRRLGLSALALLAPASL